MTVALNLLLVEDSPSDARLLEAYLEEGLLGVGSIEREGTLAGALTRLARGDVDAVLLDLGLPDSSGLDTFRRGRHEQPARSRRHRQRSERRPASPKRRSRWARRTTCSRTTRRPRIWRGPSPTPSGAKQVIEDAERTKRDQLDAKDRFLSHVSHELRTPLAAVHQFVSLVADEHRRPVG